MNEQKSKVAHIIGNGRSSSMFDHDSKGYRITCNLPPFEIKNVYTTCIVDFKMMNAITKGEIQVPGYWVLGYRPKIWCDQHPAFYMKHSKQIRQFYTKLPKYVANYTDFNCGHMATHYTASKLKPKTIHMYGFNSMFDFDLYSCTDFYLHSNRDTGITQRLTTRWRGIWPNLFAEFPDINFKLYNKHDNVKFEIPENVTIVTKK